MLIITKLLLHIPGLDCLWWLLLAMLLPLLLGLLLGYWLWYQYKKRVGELETERDELHARFKTLETDFISLKYKHDELQKDNNALRSSLHLAEADIAVLKTKLLRATTKPEEDAPVARGLVGEVKAPAVAGEIDYAALFSPGNLQIVEGIGPKVEELLHQAGINDWAALAAATSERLSNILEEAGPTYRVHDPKTWPQQAALARDGKWSELLEYQKFLDTGREDKGDFQTASKAEKMAAKVLGFSSASPDDLKIVEGIGPKIEELLKNSGINNWSDLAGKSTDELKEILAEAGDRYRLADPSTWPRQAELAAAGNWKELKEYQNYLEGGKDPGAA